MDKEVEKLADILEEEEKKQKPDASEVKDDLIVTYCQECPDHFDYDCGDHECFLWRIFSILMAAEDEN